MTNYNPNDFYPKTGQTVKSDGTTVNEADGYNLDGSQNVQLVKHNQTTIQAVNAQSVAPSGNFSSVWYDTNGFDKIAISLLNDAATTSSVDLHWSHDGSTYHAGDYLVIPSNTTQRKTAIIDTRARYLQVQANNGDTSAHVLNVWIYLKA